MKSYAQPNQSIAIHVGHKATFLGVLLAIIATSGSALAAYECSGLEGVALRHCRGLNAAAASESALAESDPEVSIGYTKPAAYGCSGLEGVALRHCRGLNAAAASRATEKMGASTGATNDCAGLTGAALSACRDLNGQVDAHLPMK
jgi:hypothetical protein